MGKGTQFLLLLWKNWTLIKRQVTRNLLQVLLPLLFIAILVLLRVFRIKDESKPPTYYNPFSISEIPHGIKVQHFAYAPDGASYAKVMENVKLQLGLNISGFKSEEAMVNSLIDAEDYLGGVYFLTSPSAKDIVYKLRLSSKSRNTAKIKVASGGQQLGSSSTSWMTQFTFPVFQLPGPRNANSSYGGPPDYYHEGFLTLQHAINHALIGIDPTLSGVSIEMNRFPYPHYIDDKFILVIQQSLPLLLMLSLVFTALNIVRDIVYEKERKLKESMKMMGLSGWLHWSAWFLKYFIFLTITVALATVLFKVKFNSHGKVLNQSDPSVIFVFLLLYSISSIMFCFCVSTFFSKANIAAAAGGIIWFISYTPYFFVSQSYDSMSLGEKLLSCLLSNVAMAMGGQLIGKLEGSGTGVRWSNLQETSVDDSFVFGHVLLMFIADSILYGLIAWYIEAVFPGEFGVPQPWYFPVLPSYWCSKGQEFSDEYEIIGNGDASMGESSEFLEKEPVGLHSGIEIQNIRKVFSTEQGKKVAVDGVSLNLYEGQITVLLGHNGAGKTTLMSMLTGLFPSSDGTAIVNGYNISDNIAGVRKSLGLCPQHNVLFDTLTVEEHLWFFAKLKGCPAWKVPEEVQEMLKCTGLLDKASTQTRFLSGGMKRKLSVGIALIGDSKVVLLDEPTSGMDPSARRFTWDLLQQQRQGRTILLTTHYMEEADLLGDRIAIMAEGKIVCCGSSLFLKNKYGVGYHMVIVKEPACDVPTVSKVIHTIVPTAKMESNVGAELSFVLPREATGRFEELFSALEKQRSQLGVASYGVSVTTMEEVFLKVGEEIDKTLPDKLMGEDNTGRLPDARSPTTQNNCLARLGTLGSASASYGTFGCYIDYGHTDGMKLQCQRWYAMFVKRMLHSKRHRLSIISQLLLPLFFMLIALINAKTFPEPGDSPALNLTTESFGKNNVPFWAPGPTSTQAGAIASIYSKQWAGTETNCINASEELSKYLTEEPDKVGLGEFNQRDLIGASFIQKNKTVTATAWFNNQAYHSVAVAIAALENALLKSVRGANRSLTTINHPLPRTVKESINDLSRNGVGFLLSFNMLFGMAFLASSFVVFLVQERTNKAKHVQFVSGVDPVSYWTSAYLWDLINFLLPALSILVLLAAFDVPAYSGERLGYTFLLLMLYGWAIIPLMYLFSFVFRTASTAFVVLTIFNILTGLATLLTVFILSIPSLDLLDVADALKWAFLVLPNYCLGQGMNDIFLNYGSIDLFDKEVQMCLSSPQCKMLGKQCTKAFCEKLIRTISNGTLQFEENYLSWHNPGIGRYLVFLSWEGIVFFALVLLIEYRVCYRIQALLGLCRPRAPPRFQRQTSVTDDDDVLDEKRRVLNSASLEDVLVIKDLTKVFKSRIGREPVVAVDGLCLGVPLSECFGLLGINGAGKTTTFRMLTGDETMTSGTAVVDGFDIMQDMSEVRQRIGYCPQFDALIEQMTGRELLYMYARLRGVPEASLAGVVDNVIQALLLQDHADKVSKSYSGGNKRKLSTAISLVGDPPVVFLDEPTTGMDPVARRLLWDALSRVRAEGRCIVITSHSMEECEALCTRIAIMVNGRFKCLGSPQHLKNKFGQGYTLLARVGGAQPDTGRLKHFIESSFAGSMLKDEHQGMVHYHIRDTRVTWAQLFGSIEEVKLAFNIEDYCVSQTTLEQVFLNFARGQREEEVILG